MLLRTLSVLSLIFVHLHAAAVAPLVDPIDFEGIFFEAAQSSRSAVLNTSQVNYLQSVADTLRHSPELRVALVGNADTSEGSEIQAISEARALLVYQWLVAQGLESQLAGHKGIGATDLVDRSDTEAQRRHNRRVDIVVENSH
jgi:outer membrane protein OmpA-like peptidoglycan-associated protein